MTYDIDHEQNCIMILYTHTHDPSQLQALLPCNVLREFRTGSCKWYMRISRQPETRAHFNVL